MALHRGSRGNDILNGTSGDDLFAGLGGNDTLHGGAGTDTAWYAGALAGYQFSADGARLVVRDSSPADGSDGTDSLHQIETLQIGSATLTASGSEFGVNSVTAGIQWRPSTAALSDGGFVVCWESDGQDGSGTGVFVQRYDASGATTGAEVRVNTFADAAQGDPSIAALADGGFVVSWTSEGQDGSSAGVYAQRFDATGSPAGVEFRVNTTTASFQEGAAVAALADGGFVVTWHSDAQDGNGVGVVARRYDASGAAVGAEIAVNTFTTGDQYLAAITALANGGFVVTWTSNGQDGSGAGVYAQRYDANGATAGTEFRVNTFTTGTQANPAITGLADGGFVVSWDSSGQDGSGFGIYAQRYDALGATVGTEFRVNSFVTGSQALSALTALADGGFVTSWQSFGQDGSSFGIFARRYDATGASTGPEFAVNTLAADAQILSAVTALADGGFLVSWASNEQDGSDYGVYAQRYDADGNPVGLTLTGTATADTINLDPGSRLVVDAAGGNDTVNGSSGDDAILGGTGNDALRGNAGNDLLDGGSGNDNLAGGAGDDLYRVDAVGDVIVELAGGGNDSVESSITFALSATVENLTLTGSANINGTGNAGGNLIEGNAGNNRLDGGAGVDILYGGKGDDTYVVDSALDAVDERAGGGTDLVLSTVSFTLSSNIENLTLGGALAIDGNGNGSANALLGNGAANVLAGAGGEDTINGLGGNDTLSGGAGNDVLTGGLGNDSLLGGTQADTFVFNAAPGATNVDTIADFSAVDDVIHLSKSVFTGLGTPAFSLPTDAFRAGAGFTTAGDATDRIIYNTTTGDLYYDRDGQGGAAAVKFAVLSGAPAITENDFFVTN